MNKRGKYLLAKELKEKGYPFKRIIEMLEIKKSTYYYHFKEKNQAKEYKKRGRKKSEFVNTMNGKIRNEELKELILEKCKNEDAMNPEYYIKTMGSKKMKSYLYYKYGIYIGHNRLHGFRKELGLVRKYENRTKHPVKRAQNRTITKQNQLWEADIKFFNAGGDGIVPLLDIIDVYDRNIVATHIGKRCTHEDFLELIEIAIKARGEKPEVIRTDNGSQFKANKTREKMKELGIIHEFGYKHNPDSQAFIESQHANLEREFVALNKFKSVKDLYLKYLVYMDYYHNLRPHSSLGYKTPKQFNAIQSFGKEVLVKR